MRIINKEQLLEAPAGTVYARYIPDILNDEIHIKVGNYCDLNLTPTWDHDNEIYKATNFCTNDLSIQADYDCDDLFAVFNKTEVKKMVDCLAWALTGCESDFNMDEVIYPDGHVVVDPDWSPFDD